MQFGWHIRFYLTLPLQISAMQLTYQCHDSLCQCNTTIHELFTIQLNTCTFYGIKRLPSLQGNYTIRCERSDFTRTSAAIPAITIAPKYLFELNLFKQSLESSKSTLTICQKRWLPAHKEVIWYSNDMSFCTPAVNKHEENAKAKHDNTGFVLFPNKSAVERIPAFTSSFLSWWA